jgi:hypothetical protein
VTKGPSFAFYFPTQQIMRRIFAYVVALGFALICSYCIVEGRW